MAAHMVTPSEPDQPVMMQLVPCRHMRTLPRIPRMLVSGSMETRCANTAGFLVRCRNACVAFIMLLSPLQ